MSFVSIRTKIFKGLVFTLGIPLALACAKTDLDSWQHIEITKNGYAQFALAMGDINGDGYAEIVAGRYLYINPKGDMTGTWTQVALPNQIQGFLIIKIPGETYPVIFGGTTQDQYVMITNSPKLDNWTAYKIGDGSIANHSSLSQGVILADVITNNNTPEIIVSGGGSVTCFVIPTDYKKSWDLFKLDNVTNGEGLAAADVNGDGKIDIFGAMSSQEVVWLENPGNDKKLWTRRTVGKTASKGAERFASGDIDGDGKVDVIVSEENNGNSLDCMIHWFKNPGNSTSTWERHNINDTPRNGTFGMSVADMDGDGDLDVITGENGRGSMDKKEETIVWENLDHGKSWKKHLLATGKESHHGSRNFDLDGDGDLDVISIGYDLNKIVDVFRNDAVKSSTTIKALKDSQGSTSNSLKSNLNGYSLLQNPNESSVILQITKKVDGNKQLNMTGRDVSKMKAGTR